MPSLTTHMCNTAITATAVYAIRSAINRKGNSGSPPLWARAIQRQPEQPEAEHTDIVEVTACVYTQNCRHVLPVVFSNFANYYSVPVRISTRQSSISFDGEKCIFTNGIRHILLQRSILSYFFFCSRLIRVGCAETSVGIAEKYWPSL